MSDSSLTLAGLLEALAHEMANAVSALAGESTTVNAGPAPAATEWLVRVSVDGQMAGELRVGVSDEDARRISATVMGFDPAEVADDAVTDTLREICGQAIGALHVAPETSGVKLAVIDVSRHAFEADVIGSYRFTAPGGVTPALVVGGEVVVGPAKASAAPVAVAVAQDVPAPVRPASTPSPVGNLDLLLDIELPLAVRFGQTELTLQTLTRLGPGSVIDLHRSADEPVEVLVSGKVIARGEVVVVEGNYGVRVTEVVSTADRIRSLGA
jgi:flagellar motor switch protein FliN/FliY